MNGRTDLRNNPTFSNFPGVVWTLTKSNVQYQPGISYLRMTTDHFLAKMTLICMKMKLHAELIYILEVSNQSLGQIWALGKGERFPFDKKFQLPFPEQHFSELQEGNLVR